MKINEFIHFNSHCPICGNPLHFYMQWIDSICFKAVKMGDDLYKFFPFFGNPKEIKDDNDIRDDDYMLMQAKHNNIDISFSRPGVLREAKKYTIYFFFLCNPKGINVKEWGDYEISLYQGCYYRDTPFFEFEKGKGKDKGWYIQPKDKVLTNVVNHESYSFKEIKNEHEKVYMINLNYEKNLTTLWHWSATLEERSQPDFKPKLFQKDMPLLKTRIKAGIQDRERTIDRLNSWILMS